MGLLPIDQKIKVQQTKGQQVKDQKNKS